MSNRGARVEACLPLKVSVIPPGSVDRRRTAVLNGPQIHEQVTGLGTSLHERKDPLGHLASRIESLESKIDVLLSMMLKKQQQQARAKSISLEIHGEGILFRWPEAIEPGRVVELDLELSMMPPTEIYFLAEVRRCEPEPDDGDGASQFLVNATYSAIDETSLDWIHRFILTSQRQQRRRDINQRYDQA